MGPAELQSKLLKGVSVGDYIGDYYSGLLRRTLGV